MDDRGAELDKSCIETRRSPAGLRECTSKSTRREESELVRPSLFDDDIEFFFSHWHD